jgi:hypothetical protein
MADLRLLLEPMFLETCEVKGTEIFFSIRGSVLASISKLRQNNFETI